MVAELVATLSRIVAEDNYQADLHGQKKTALVKTLILKSAKLLY